MVILGLALVAVAAATAFVLRQRRAPSPLYDLRIARRRIFWVAAAGGVVVFGALMGAVFIGQQFMQNVLGYSPLMSGAAILPAAAAMVLVAPRSATLVVSHGARFTLLLGYFFCLLGFITMLLLWTSASPYWQIGLGYAFVGIGVGFAGTPASHSLTSSVPVTRAGMASGTADLQRDLGAAILQSVFGALLTAGYASAFSATIAGAPASTRNKISVSVQNELTKSFASASAVAKAYPKYASQITAAARSAFLHGDRWAYAAGVLSVLLGAAIVRFFFPPRQAELRLIEQYQAQDAAAELPEAGGRGGPGSGRRRQPGQPWRLSGLTRLPGQDERDPSRFSRFRDCVVSGLATARTPRPSGSLSSPSSHRTRG